MIILTYNFPTFLHVGFSDEKKKKRNVELWILKKKMYLYNIYIWQWKATLVNSRWELIIFTPRRNQGWTKKNSGETKNTKEEAAAAGGGSVDLTLTKEFNASSIGG